MEDKLKTFQASVMFILLTCASVARSEESHAHPGFQDPQVLTRLSAEVAISHNVAMRGTAIHWMENRHKQIFMAAAGPRFITGEHFWVMPQFGAARNWFHDGGNASLMSVESEYSFFHEKLTLTVEVDAYLAPGRREGLVWATADYHPTKVWDIGVHSEIIGTRTAAFGPNAGFTVFDHHLHCELQYLEGKFEHQRGRALRLFTEILFL